MYELYALVDVVKCDMILMYPIQEYSMNPLLLPSHTSRVRPNQFYLNFHPSPTRCARASEGPSSD